MSALPFHRMKGPGDFDAPAELEGEPGPIWGDMAEIETTLKDSDFFADECAEIMADFLLSYGDTYAIDKMLRSMRKLADRCHAHIDEKEAEL